jgi:hypothetical protein
MSQLVKKIRTESGDLQIDYNALANLPGNPNLLINSDFRNPINQRGKTSYKNDKDWSWCYGIDRWACNASLNSCEVTVNDASITIANNGNSEMHFRQLFEQAYDNGTYTATINVIAVTGNVVVHFDGGAKSRTLTVGKNVITLNATPEHFNLLISAGASIELVWIKLEVGSVSTPFVPRIYGEEVYLCKRFCQTVNLHWRTGVVNSAGTIISFVADVLLRTLPSGSPLVTLYEVPTRIRTTSSNSIDTTLTLENVQLSNGMIVLNIASSTKLDARSVAVPIDEFKFLIDAEIY